MAWTVPITFIDGDPLTAAQLNTFVRDNFRASETGIATTSGRMITTVDTHKVTESQWARDIENSFLQIHEPYFVTEDDEGSLLGPTVTVQHNGLIWLLYDARIDMDTTNGNAMYAPVVNGSMPDTTKTSARSGAEGLTRIGATSIWTGEPGIAEITMGYGGSNNSASMDYHQRRLTAVPF